MKNKTPLWNVAIVTTQAFAPIVEDLWSEEAKAVSTTAKPRHKEAQVDVLFDYDPDPSALHAKLAVACLIHQAPAPQVTITQVGNVDWLKKVASDFPPIKIARWTVHGAAHRAEVPDRAMALEIEAANAFGTGEHPTTHGCLVLLDKILGNNNLTLNHMLDVGCGSGILSMAFVQATQGTAVAVDLDPEAVEITKSNAKLNHLHSFMKIGLSDGYKAPLVQKNAPYDLIMSNIFADPLCVLAPDLFRVLRPNGYVILAGLLTTQADKVIAAHKGQGLILRRRLVIGEWTILSFQKKAA